MAMRSGFGATGEARRSASRATRSRGVRTLRRRRSPRYVRRGAARAAAAQTRALDLVAATRESASFAPRRGGAALGARVGHPFHVVVAMVTNDAARAGAAPAATSEERARLASAPFPFAWPYVRVQVASDAGP